MGDLEVRFGRRVRELRVEQGLSQEQLAQASGVARTFVGGVERGQRSPTIGTIQRLARALGVSLPELADVESKRSEPAHTTVAVRFANRVAAMAEDSSEADVSAIFDLLERFARLYFKRAVRRSRR
jgi:transcriptional regulator with XRE-family HTH domain